MADKDNVIYLETDEDITSAIDKVIQSASGSVQIVTPKRSTLLQSLINQKLIKKAADDAGKKLVIVTNDRVATNLAARTGIPVATRVGAAPVLPVAPEKPDMPSDEIESSAADDEDAQGALEDDEPVGEPEKESVPEIKPDPEPVSPVITRTPVKPLAPAAAAASAKTAKSQRVPNFGNMQKRLLWISLAVVAVIGLLAVNILLTSAKVTLFAKATSIDSTVSFKADTTASASLPEQGVLAAEQLELTKSLSPSAPATGQKDVGTKAKGSMTVSNCYDTQPHTLVAGTRFQAPDGKIFRSDSDVTVPGGTGSFFGCTTPGKATVPVTADQNGDGYNLASGTKYTIPALPQSQQAGISGVGNQMSGGTSKTVKVVTQADVDKLKAATLEKDKSVSQKELSEKAKGKVLIDVSFEQKVNNADSSPGVGEEAAQVKLNLDLTYSALTVKKDDFSELAKAQQQKQLGGQNEIYDDGTDRPKFVKGKAPGEFTAALVAYAGARINKDELAKQMKAKKYGDAVDIAARTEGIDKAEISLTPGWATSMPWLTSRIKIDIKVSDIGQR